MKRFWRLGMMAQVCVVVAMSILAYAGIIHTSIPSLPHIDLLGHALGIGLLGFFLDGVLDHRPLVRGLAFPRLAPVLVLSVAGLEEYLQRYSPRRASTWSDYAADVAGVCFFCWLSRRVARSHALVPAAA